MVCYGELGCFRDEGPFNYLDMLPSPPEEIGTVFYLYTRKNNEQAQMLDFLNVTSITASNFNVSNPTKFIIHGFSENGEEEWEQKMKDALLDAEDCNVIIVDWARVEGLSEDDHCDAAVKSNCESGR